MAEPRVVSLTMRQLVSLIGAVTALSGTGAAVTVKANDAAQDEKIARVEVEQSKVSKKLDEASRELAEVSTKVENVEKKVDKSEARIRDDVKELREIIIRSLENHR